LKRLLERGIMPQTATRSSQRSAKEFGGTENAFEMETCTNNYDFIPGESHPGCLFSGHAHPNRRIRSTAFSGHQLADRNHE
jgi:hypothetical protein